MDQIVEKVSNLNIADSSNNNLKKNQIQVSNTKKLLFFYVNLAKDRRRIESDFFSGKLCGIAATNALELGIDIGHIDATLHLGFPGSVASLWQQAGRSGRRGKPSLDVYVAFEGPLDQYFMNFVVTGLIEIQALPYLGISVADFTLDEKAELLFVDQSITTAAVLGVLFSLTNTLQPLPEDLYRYGMKLTTTRATFQV